MNIRAMQPRDVDVIAEIEQENYYEPWTHQIIQDCLNVGYQCVVLEQASQIVGYTITMQVLDEYHLLNIAIKKNMQNQGLGEKLMQDLIDKAKQNQGKHIFLEVRASNLAARHLYQKLGFIEVGLRKDYYSGPVDREDAVLYTLSI